MSTIIRSIAIAIFLTLTMTNRSCRLRNLQADHYVRLINRIRQHHNAAIASAPPMQASAPTIAPVGRLRLWWWF